MLTNEDLLGIQGRISRWASLNSGTKFRSTGGNQLVRRVMTVDAPAMLEEIERLKARLAVVDTADESYLIAGRDQEGNICMSRGNGAIVTMAGDDRLSIQKWHDRALHPEFRAEFRAALDLLDREEKENG